MKEVTELVQNKMMQINGSWTCSDCNWTSGSKTRLFEHIEAKHVEHAGYTCTLCLKFCPSLNSLKCHTTRYHRMKK